MELISSKIDMLLTIQSEVNKQLEKEEKDTEVDRQLVKNEIFSKYILEKIEIDGTKKQQA
ncbi:7824_t:CDS:2, partial [Gigaspora margarita]